MATFTKLDRDAMSALLRQYSVGALLEMAPIAKGTINSNFRVDTSAGRVFLRVNEGKAREEVEYEAALVDWLSTRGVVTPRVISTSEGASAAAHGESWVTVFEWLPGREVSRDEVTPAHTAAVGAALARMHAAGDGFPQRRAGRYTPQLIEQRYQSFVKAKDAALSRAIDVLGDELAWLAGGDRTGLPSGVIHQDLFRDNVLWSDPETAQLGGLIDLEQACDGAFAYDLAVCLNDWCFASDYKSDAARALVAGYQSVRPLTPRERGGLWIEARAAAARFTITRITDVHLRAAAGGAASPTDKDFRRYLARLERLKALGRGGFSRMIGLDDVTGAMPLQRK